MALLLKAMDNDRYFSEYCNLMSNLVDPRNPQTASQLRTLAFKYENSSKSVPECNDSSFAATLKPVSTLINTFEH